MKSTLKNLIPRSIPDGVLKVWGDSAWTSVF